MRAFRKTLMPGNSLITSMFIVGSTSQYRLRATLTDYRATPTERGRPSMDAAFQSESH